MKRGKNQPVLDTLRKKIAGIIEERFSNKKAFAEFVGIDKSTVYQALDDPAKRDFTLPHLLTIAEKTGIPIYNLFHEESLIPASSAEERIDQAMKIRERYEMVPQIEAVACGHLSVIDPRNIVDYHVFSREYLRGCFKPFLTRASGDSMHPTIQDGDLILFDRNPDRLERPNQDHMYLINTSPFSEEISLTIKRAQIKKNDLWLFPDNSRYQAYTVEMAENSSPLQYLLAVAVWVGKDLDK